MADELAFIESREFSQFNHDEYTLHQTGWDMEDIRLRLEPSIGDEAWNMLSFYIKWNEDDDGDKIIIEAWGYYRIVAWDDTIIYRII
jgi:hypothetical protein